MTLYTVEKIKTKSAKVKQELRKQTLNFILAGFGVAAGLAWNDAIKSLIDFLFPVAVSGRGIVAKFLYAAIITLAVVIASLTLMKLLKTDEPESDKKDI